jgi:hypothetical protein
MAPACVAQQAPSVQGAALLLTAAATTLLPGDVFHPEEQYWIEREIYAAAA